MEHITGAEVPQVNALGALERFFSDLLQLIPEANAYANYSTLTFLCDPTDYGITVALINHVMNIAHWG